MWPNPQFPADLVTFTEETFDGKLLFFFLQCLGSIRRFVYVRNKWVEKSWKFELNSWVENMIVSIYLFKINNGNTRTMCEIYSELTIKTTKQREWFHSGVFIISFDQISHIICIVDLEQLNTNCVCSGLPLTFNFSFKGFQACLSREFQGFWM